MSEILVFCLKIRGTYISKYYMYFGTSLDYNCSTLKNYNAFLYTPGTLYLGVTQECEFQCGLWEDEYCEF